MKTEFRATGPEHASEIAALLRSTFGMRPEHPALTVGMMQWKYWDPRPDWQGSRSYALFRNDEMAAHGAVVPVRCTDGARTLRMFHLIDWAAKPDAVGAGSGLLRRLSALA